MQSATPLNYYIFSRLIKNRSLYLIKLIIQVNKYVIIFQKTHYIKNSSLYLANHTKQVNK